MSSYWNFEGIRPSIWNFEGIKPSFLWNVLTDKSVFEGAMPSWFKFHTQNLRIVLLLERIVDSSSLAPAGPFPFWMFLYMSELTINSKIFVYE